jgi:hypothetical protein
MQRIEMGRGKKSGKRRESKRNDRKRERELSPQCSWLSGGLDTHPLGV